MSDDHFSEQEEAIAMRQMPGSLPVRDNIQKVLIIYLDHLVVFDRSLVHSSWVKVSQLGLGTAIDR